MSVDCAASCHAMNRSPRDSRMTEREIIISLTERLLTAEEGERGGGKWGSVCNRYNVKEEQRAEIRFRFSLTEPSRVDYTGLYVSGVCWSKVRATMAICTDLRPDKSYRRKFDYGRASSLPAHPYHSAAKLAHSKRGLSLPLSLSLSLSLSLPLVPPTFSSEKRG